MVYAPEYFVIIPPGSPGVPPTDQICSKCGQVKPLEEFYLRPTPNDPNHRHRQCKACQNTKASELYVRDRERQLARGRAYRAKAGEAEREQNRVTSRAYYAQMLRRAGRPYQPRPRGRKDPVLTPEEIRQLVRDALTELNRAELFAKGFMQGSRAAGNNFDLTMLLAPLACAQSALHQILPLPCPTQPATGHPAGTAAKPKKGPDDKDGTHRQESTPPVGGVAAAVGIRPAGRLRGRERRRAAVPRSSDAQGGQRQRADE
jgi:hypothetical protein